MFYEIAAKYAEMGIPVIPVQPKDKACKLPHWQELATTDLKQIEQWNEENPDFNVGAVAQNHGVVILDCDVRGMMKRIQEETGRRLPETFIVKSGKGLAHIYFLQTDVSRKLGNRNAINPSGGEFFSLRQHNRYVVGAGSLHPNGKYYEIHKDAEIALFPDWLAPWICKYSEVEKPKPTSGQLVVSDEFDFDAFCEHYGIEYFGNGPWFITPICPYKGDRHEQSKLTGFYFDGNTFGFHCFAAGCGDPSIGHVIKRLNDGTQSPYTGPIWPEQPINYDDPKWNLDDCTPEAATLADIGAEIQVEKPNEEVKIEVVDVPTEQAPSVALAETVPEASVDLFQFPKDSMYGALGRLAEEMDCPLGYAYSAMLAVGAAHGPIDIGDHVRGNLYVALIGPIGNGKSVAIERAIQSVFIPERHVVKITPGSDRGLIKLLGKEGRKILLVQDEFRNTLNKCSYQGSSLAPVLCQLWSDDVAGAADKRGIEECDASLSILGNVACEDPAEFSAVFGSQTTKGLSDRFILGIAPPIQYRPIKLKGMPIDIKPCNVPGWCFEEKHKWVGEVKERRRLGEMALRIALITSCLNEDPEVNERSMEAALKFCEWQAHIRNSYKPGIGESKEAMAEEAVYAALAEKGTGVDIHWAKTMNNKSYYRRFGSVLLNRIKKSLLNEGVIAGVREEGEDGKNKLTPYVRLKGRVK